MSPEQPDRIRFACACGRKLKAEPALTGKRVQCPSCGEALTVPGVPKPTPPAAPRPPATESEAPAPKRPRPAGRPVPGRPAGRTGTRIPTGRSGSRIAALRAKRRGGESEEAGTGTRIGAAVDAATHGQRKQVRLLIGLVGGLAALVVTLLVVVLIAMKAPEPPPDEGETVAADTPTEEAAVEPPPEPEPPPPPPPEPESLADLAERLEPGVVYIHVANGNAQNEGTGFFVESHGRMRIVTNWHVIQNAGKVSVEILRSGGNTETDRYEDVEIVATDPVRDIAVLDLPGFSREIVTLELETETPPRKGDNVFIIGHPAQGRWILTEGVLSTTHRELDGIPFLQTDSAVNPGNSGGPMFNRDRGRVIGLVSRKGGGQNIDNIGYALPIADVIRFLDALDGEEQVFTDAEMEPYRQAKRAAAEQMKRQAAVYTQALAQAQQAQGRARATLIQRMQQAAREMESQHRRFCASAMMLGRFQERRGRIAPAQAEFRSVAHDFESLTSTEHDLWGGCAHQEAALDRLRFLDVIRERVSEEPIPAQLESELEYLRRIAGRLETVHIRPLEGRTDANSAANLTQWRGSLSHVRLRETEVLGLLGRTIEAREALAAGRRLIQAGHGPTRADFDAAERTLR